MTAEVEWVDVLTPEQIAAGRVGAAKVRLLTAAASLSGACVALAGLVALMGRLS